MVHKSVFTGSQLKLDIIQKTFQSILETVNVISIRMYLLFALKVVSDQMRHCNYCRFVQRRGRVWAIYECINVLVPPRGRHRGCVSPKVDSSSALCCIFSQNPL